jgi:hypothetical membrane protein
MNVRLVQIFGYFGIFTPILGFAMVLIAIRTAPWFSWTGNALSDLGVEGFTAIVFNHGLQMTAALMSLYALGVYELTKGDAVGQTGFLLILAGAVFLFFIGLFPETAGRVHFYFSVAFFVSLPLSTLTLAYYTWKQGCRRLSYLSATVGAVAALVWVPEWGAVAIPEALSALAVGVWSSVFGFWMTKMDESWD